MKAMDPVTDLRPGRVAGRRPREAYAQGFCDLVGPLDLKQAESESSRCYFCHDAPCIQACPTSINIPEFIRRIQTGNPKGAAVEILEANPLGGTCARVCPVEILCEAACVRNAEPETKPVAIGRLQRYATDALFASGEQPFSRAPATGKRVAVVGAGPAGLACAHGLARLGHEVDLFDARPRAGGLNEYGIAAYKMAGEFAQREVAFLLGVGGIRWHAGRALGRDLDLAQLGKDYGAVFVGVGLGATQSLGIEGESLAGVRDAVEFIAELRQSGDLAQLPVGRRVVVIGGGNTAIDAAIQSKRLGADEVTLVYRRGPETMSATAHEQHLAQVNGVVIRHWAKPTAIVGGPAGVTGIRFERTRAEGGKLLGLGDFFELPTDSVLKAIGQKLVAPESWAPGLKHVSGKLAVSAEYETSVPGVYAGGDCIDSGPGREDLTVVAVEDGKRAARAIHARLSGGKTHG